MRKLNLLAAWVVLAALAAPAAAQNHADIDVGWALPNGDVAENFDGGLGFNGRFIKETTPFLGFGVGVGFQMFDLGADIEKSIEAQAPNTTVSGGGMNVLTAEFLLEAKSGSVDLTRYAGWVGAGLFQSMASDLDVTTGGNTQTFEGQSKARFGFSIGGSAHIPMGGFRLGATAQIRIFTVEALTADAANVTDETLSFFTFALSASKDL
jgi:hypothetical protein